MRIISGKLKSRQFNSPPGHKTHPMSDKMRGGLFNALGDISGLTIFDAYGGSGAISFEAISRGASDAVVIENTKEAIKTIKLNIELLNLSSQVKLIAASSSAWAKRSNQTFDVVILDPPYNDVRLKQIEILSKKVNPEGVVVLSVPKTFDQKLSASYKLIKEKDYGDGKLLFFKLS